MIINVRGTSGSGKTTVIRGIMAKGGLVDKIYSDQAGDGLFSTSKAPIAYDVNVNPGGQHVYVIGSYENTCGGCDSIKTQDEICNRVRWFAKQGHVIMEGLLMSHLFSRYAALDRELQPTPYIWAFLDTPLELCLERVIARREARGVAKKPFNPENTVSKWNDARRVFAKCQKDGLDARWVNHLDPVTEVWSWLAAS